MSQRIGREQQKRKSRAVEDEDESDETSQSAAKRHRKPTKKRHRNAEDDDDDDDDDEEDVFGFGTQGGSVGKITDEDREKLVSNFVRYCLFQDSIKMPIKQAEIGKAVIKDYATKGRGLVQFVVAEGKRRLADTFGMELVELPKSVILDEEGFKGSGSYVLRPQPRVSALLSAIPSSTIASTDQFGLLCCMLAVIDMHDRTSAPEDEFYNALESLDLHKGVAHNRFGDWEGHFRTFCKQQYLVREKAVHATDQSTHLIGFGPRAVVEFGRVGIRHMTCRLVGTTPDPTRLKLLAERDIALHGRGTTVDEQPQPSGPERVPRPARRESVRPRAPPSVVDLVE